MICAQAVIHFRPNQSYEKYLKLLVSVMILVQIFQPVGRFFLTDGGEEISDRIKWFQEQLDQGMEQAARAGGASGDLLERMALQEVQERLAEQTAGESAEESTESDETSTEKISESGIPPVEKVEPVKIK